MRQAGYRGPRARLLTRHILLNQSVPYKHILTPPINSRDRYMSSRRGLTIILVLPRIF